MDSILAGSALGTWLAPRIQSVGDFIFFRSILSYLRNEIREFGLGMMANAMQWVGGIALTLLTLWILLQGWRIVTGQTRDSMAVLVSNALRATLVVTVATSMAMAGSGLHQFLTGDVKKEINYVVTGKNEGPEEAIDRNLAWMQVALSSIDVLDIASDPTLDSAKSRALWFAGFGTGGPAITAGTMLLLYEVALALFIGLGPIFILCLLFDQTKSLFSRWLFYGIGTMFSMAVLSAMVSIALEMVTRVSAAFWGASLVGTLMGSNFSDGMTSQAMQQGGMGLILTALIVSAPPMAAMFFQGTLGQFYAFSQFEKPAGGMPPGASGPGSPASPAFSAPERSQLPSGSMEARSMRTTQPGQTDGNQQSGVSGQRGLASRSASDQ